MIITKIEIQAKNPERVNLYADGKFWVGISALVCHNLNLKVGTEVTAQLMLRLGKAEEGDRAWQYALRSLGLSPKTVGQMKRQLEIRFGPAQAAKVMDRLCDQGLLNDESTARALVEQAARGLTKSRLEIVAALKARFVDAAVIKLTLAELPEDYDLQTARRLANARLAGSDNDRAAITKTAHYLSRKGFSYAVIGAVVKGLGGEVE